MKKIVVLLIAVMVLSFSFGCKTRDGKAESDGISPQSEGVSDKESEVERDSKTYTSEDGWSPMF